MDHPTSRQVTPRELQKEAKGTSRQVTPQELQKPTSRQVTPRELQKEVNGTSRQVTPQELQKPTTRQVTPRELQKEAKATSRQVTPQELQKPTSVALTSRQVTPQELQRPTSRQVTPQELQKPTSVPPNSRQVTPQELQKPTSVPPTSRQVTPQELQKPTSVPPTSRQVTPQELQKPTSVPPTSRQVTPQELQQPASVPPTSRQVTPEELERVAKAPTLVGITPEELQKVAKDAADQAVADNEELMEAVIKNGKETVRMLRSELTDLATVKDETANLKQAVAKLTKQQLDFAVKDQVNQQVANLNALYSQIKADIAVRPKAAPASAPTSAPTSKIKDESVKEQLVGWRTQMQDMRMKLDPITRSELEASKETTLSALQAHGTAILENVDKRVSEFNTELLIIKSSQAASLSSLKEVDSGLRASLSQIKSELVNGPLSQMSFQMQELQAKLAERIVPTDMVTRSDLEAVKEGALSELRGHKEYVDQKILQIKTQVFEQLYLPQTKREEDGSFMALPGLSQATKQNVHKQILDLPPLLSEIKEPLAQDTDKFDSSSTSTSTRVDLDETQVPENVQEKNLKVLNGHVADSRKQSTRLEI